MNLTKKNSGFTTLEILIALALMIITVTAVVTVAYGSSIMSGDSQTNAEGLRRAQRALEEAEASAKSNFNSISTSSRTLDTASDPYYKQLLVSGNPCVVSLTSTYDWAEENGRHSTTTLTSVITNPEAYFNMGGACSTTPPTPPGGGGGGNDWHYPYGFTAVARGGFGDVDVLAIQKLGNILYVSTGANSATKQDIGTADVSTVNPPISSDATVLDSEDEGVKQYSALAVARKGTTSEVYAYTYVGNDASSEQFQVINVSNPSSISTAPVKVDLAGSSTAGRDGGDIYYYKNRVYVATGLNSAQEFYVYDVTTPSLPSFVTSKEINRDVYKVIVREQVVSGVLKTLAYLSLSSPSAGDAQMIVIDLATMNQIGSFVAPNGHEDGMGLYILGNTAFLGRSKDTSGSHTEPNFYAINISDPTHPSAIGSFNVLGNDIKGLVVANNFAFLQTADGLHVLNVTYPNAVTAPSISPYGIFVADHGINAITTDGNLVFASSPNQGSTSLYVIYSHP